MAAAGLLAAVTVITFASVILRYLFAWSIPDGFDLRRNLQGILIFWGIALTGYRGDHIGMDVIWGVLGPASRRVMDVFATLVTLGAMAAFAWMLLDKVVTTESDNVRTFDLQLPVWPFFLLAWIGIAAAVVLLVLRLWRVAAGTAAARAAASAAD